VIAVEIVVLGVRNSEEAGKYVLEATIGGVYREFVFGDVSGSIGSLSVDRNYEELFAASMVSKKIGRFVLDFRDGRKNVFPQRLQMVRRESGEKP
jgi:hypothetical protein